VKSEKVGLEKVIGVWQCPTKTGFLVWQQRMECA